MPVTERVTRDAYLEILHDLKQTGNRFDATFDGTLAGLNNRLVAGFDVSRVDFRHTNNSPFLGSSSVDPFNFLPGNFISPVATTPRRQADLDSMAFFAENALDLTPRWKLVAGLRKDRMTLDSTDLLTAVTGSQTYSPLTGRLGTVWRASAALSLYGQYATGTDPLSGSLTLPSNLAHGLTKGEQIEFGAKGELPSVRGEWTASVYRLEKRGILSRDATNPLITQQIGQQSSTGVELALAMEPVRGWSIDANLAMLRARFDSFNEVVGEVLISRNGNTPVNVPERTANLWTSYRFAPQWQAGVGLQYVGARAANTANTLSFPSYTTVDALLRYEFSRNMNLALSVSNLADKDYAISGTANTRWLLGIGMHGDMPVWRVLGTDGQGGAPLWRAVDARSGQMLLPLSVEAGRAVAEAFSGRRAVYSEVLERDQWTVPQGLNPYRPLLRVELDGPGGLELYVSLAAAVVVRDTRRAERFWNWLGAVPHWIYFTELRQYPQAWHNVIVWLSIPGVVLSVTGIVLGMWHLFLNRSRWIPYRRFWMRWHHISGLVAAIFTLTWIFSGLLSMNPFSVFSPRAALPAEHAQWLGPKAAVTLNPAQAQAAASGVQAREIDVLQVAGQAWYRLRDVAAQALVRADGAGDLMPQPTLPDETVQASLRALRPGDAILTRLTAYDELYYAREITDNTPHARPLPVWRARWADGVTVYADPASAQLLLRADASNRWQRVLYAGLHSFDFAPLLARPWLRDTLIVLLSLLGTALCVTSCVIAWRVLVPRKRK